MDRIVAECTRTDCVNHEVKGRRCNNGKVVIDENGCRNFEPYERLMQKKSSGFNTSQSGYKTKHITRIK